MQYVLPMVAVAAGFAVLLKMMLELRPVIREIDDEMWRR